MKRFLTLTLMAASVAMPATAQTPAPAQIFGTNGCADIAYPGMTWMAYKSHALQPDGKLLLAGWGLSGTFEACMARIDTACGELDPTFGQNGILRHFFEARTLCHTIALQPDGKIVGAGLIAPGNGSSSQFPGVFRLNADGSVDNTFNGTGYNNTGFSTGLPAGTVQDLFIDDNGRILAAVMGYSQMGVFRYLPDGTLDNSYSTDGRAEMPVAYTPFQDDIAGVMDPDGSVTVAGLVGTGPFDPTHMALARFTPAGEPDMSFGTNGLAVHPTVFTTHGTPDGFEDWSIVRRPGGGYLVGYGGFDGGNRPRVAAFTDTGALDQSYGTDGIYQFAAGDPQGSALWMDPDGSAMLFLKHHSSTGPSAIVKLDANGQPDASFGTNGLLLVPFGQPLDNRGFADGFRLPGGDIIGYGGSSATGFGTVARLTLEADANALPVISFDYPDLQVSGGGSIQWFLDGLPISGANASTYTPTQNGTYTVEMNSFGCVNTSPPFQFLSTGITDAGSPGILIRQDFTMGMVFIQSDGPLTTWDLMDASGRIVRQGTLSTGSNEISVSDLRSGIYLLRSMKSSHRIVVP